MDFHAPRDVPSVGASPATLLTHEIQLTLSVSCGSSADSTRQKYALKGWSADRLKKVLKGNHQRTDGTKSMLVARCVDMELNGALPHCPKCAKLGKTESVSPSEDGLGYKCDGYKDDDGQHECVLGRNLKHTEVRNTYAGSPTSSVSRLHITSTHPRGVEGAATG
jgi:hypothetical protein